MTRVRTALLLSVLGIVLCARLNSALSAPANPVPPAADAGVGGAAESGNAVTTGSISQSGGAASSGGEEPGAAAEAAAGMSIQTMGSLNDKRPLTIGDKLSFSVVEDEKPPTEIAITDSGEADVPYIGRVMAADKTCKQLAYQIKAMLEKDFYYQATVLIGLDSAGNRAVSRGKIYVMGEVNSQGPQDIPADEDYTVSKAILRAGGFGPYANKRKVRLIRAVTGHGGPQTIIVDMVDVMEKGQTDKDMEVAPDDRIIVPQNLINF
jgi:protein involved in polysaccharide export with SLBB domain